MTPQQLFDNAVKGLAAQGWQRSGKAFLDSNGKEQFQCLYLAADGKRCAIGHSLRKEDCILFDNMPFGANDVAHELGWPSPKHSYHGDLQMAHDMAKDPAAMVENFRAVARQYNLDASTLGPEPGKAA